MFTAQFSTAKCFTESIPKNGFSAANKEEIDEIYRRLECGQKVTIKCYIKSGKYEIVQ